ncbi:MAG: ABC transporter ATP-binding protein [Thermoanaerobaculia bacterium]
MTVLDLRAVRYRYPGAGRDALAGVTASVRAGELVSIVGANGSGKSTLMKLLARVVEPIDGDVAFRGRSLAEWSARDYAQRVGYLAQEAEAVFPMRVLDVVLTGRAPFLGRFEWESERDVERARRALEECDVAAFEQRFLDAMSGGERKRVELARVLAGEPELVLLDEPLAALDLAHAQQLARLLRSIARSDGRTVLFVSHDLNWSAALADRMIVLREGRVAADGPPSEIVREEGIRAWFDLDAAVVEVEGRPWVVPRA